MSKNEERAMRYSLVDVNLRKLEGELLTIVDAFAASEKQNKAIKDLVREKMARRYDWFHDICFHEQKFDGKESETMIVPDEDRDMGDIVNQR